MALSAQFAMPPRAAPAEAPSQSEWRNSWHIASSDNKNLNLFALVDPAQDATVLQRIASDGADHACLYGYELDTPIAKSTPRLVALGTEINGHLLPALLSRMPHRPVATLMGACCDISTLANHLRNCMDIQLENVDSMFLAYWDPAILGTLLGVREDETLHVSGPVLTPRQIVTFLGPIRHWWYWDRAGQMHDAVAYGPDRCELSLDLPLSLDAEQTDMLIEASVPDHLLFHISTNLPELLDRLPAHQRYPFVRQQLERARNHGLTGTGDLVNYVSIALAFGAMFDKLPAVAQLLARVTKSEISFDHALEQLPEQDLEQNATSPGLLP